jgi:T-box
MFPSLKFRVYDLDPCGKYCFLLDMAPVDGYRYKFHDSRWMVSRTSEDGLADSFLFSDGLPRPASYHVHPDSPANGDVWMSKVLSFHRLKLTNNTTDNHGHVSWRSYLATQASREHCILESIYRFALPSTNVQNDIGWQFFVHIRLAR